MSAKDAQKYLSISKSAMYRLIQSGTISHAKFRGKIAIPRLALYEYAASKLTIGSVA